MNVKKRVSILTAAMITDKRSGHAGPDRPGQARPEGDKTGQTRSYQARTGPEQGQYWTGLGQDWIEPDPGWTRTGHDQATS